MQTKLRIKNQARELRSQGYSLNQISRKLNIAKSSISIWTRDIRLNDAQRKLLKNRELEGGIKGRAILSEKWRIYSLTHPKPDSKGPRWLHRSVESFFDSWNPNMAYILGYFTADGWISKNKRGSCYLGFTSTDKELILIVKRLMKVSNKVESYQPKGNTKLSYTIQIGSKILFKKLESLGFTPNKSLTIKLPNIPFNVLGHFLRGYFDGDGCASFVFRERKDRNNKLYPIYSVQFVSGSYRFLKALQTRLKSAINLTNGSLYTNHNCSRLTYTSNNVVKLFSFMYNQPGLPFLKRKYIILKKGFDYWGRSSIG
ncbi:LAGLIDADG family homing endonuclease [Candidatus Daviesbacteria bacterium]|nr:LAGLIDADG family homing endonuclease [Candidatus Daviesbacteria bacterium]